MAKKKKRETSSHNGVENRQSVSENSAQASEQELDAVAAWSENDPRFWWAALGLLVVGIALRQWQLAAFPYHHDEAIHAWYSLGFKDYDYNPIYHGPLLYHLVAGVFALPFFGANDYTARLVPSLLGVGLLALVLWPARRWLGARGALWCLAILAISPVMVSYQRRLLHDALVLVLTLGAVLCFQTARDNRSDSPSGRRARVGLAVLLALFVATKANAFFVIGMLLAFWIALKLPRLWRERGESLTLPRWLPLVALPAFLIFLYLDLLDTPLKASLVAAASRLGSKGPLLVNALLGLQMIVAFWLALQWRGLWRNRSGMARSPWYVPITLFLIVAVASYFALREVPGRERMFTIICVLSVLALWEWLRHSPEPESENGDDGMIGAERSRQWWRFDWRTPMLAAAVAGIVFAFLYGHGVLWWQIPLEMARDPQQGLNSLQMRWAEVKHALPNMLEYWVGQQNKPRLPGRHDYYLPLMLLYELPIVIAALGGIIYASRRRAPFTDLLLWWAFTSFTVYAIANEKVPWLLTHIMLPLALLAGWWLAHLRPSQPVGQRALAGCCAVGALFLLRGVSATNFERAADRHEPMFYAQTPEEFRDVFFGELERTKNLPGAIWVHGEKQWPTAWYLRQGAPFLNGSSVLWSGEPPRDQPLRLAVHLTEANWDSKVAEQKMAPAQLQQIKGRFSSWKNVTVGYYIWPRPSWPALRPDRFWLFWRRRVVTPADELKKPHSEWRKSLLSPPGEWSYAEAVISAPPCSDAPCP